MRPEHCQGLGDPTLGSALWPWTGQGCCLALAAMGNAKHLIVALLCLAVLFGCKAPERRDAATQTKASAANASGGLGHRGHDPGTVAGSVPSAVAKDGPALPQLKPIAKGQFPDGATEEQVCEAIADVDEQDPWVRFGHLVPAYVHGVAFVLRAGPERVQEIYDYVLKRYNGGGTWGPRIKGCSSVGKSILYIYSFGPDGVLSDGRTTGPNHLTAELQRELGIGTETWVQFLGQSEVHDAGGADRLDLYCRADPYLCEALVTLQSGPTSKGLCPWAVSRTGVADGSPEEAALLERCRRRQGAPFACVFFRKTLAEDEQCRLEIKRELGKP